MINEPVIAIEVEIGENDVQRIGMAGDFHGFEAGGIGQPQFGSGAAAGKIDQDQVLVGRVLAQKADDFGRG